MVGSSVRAQSVSVANGTWFENVRLRAYPAVWIKHGIACDWDYNDFKKQCRDSNLSADDQTKLSSATITAWKGYCREMAIDQFTNAQNYRGQNGGILVIVQIRESFFGHRKYECV